MADRSPPDLYLFRNYPSPQSQLGIGNYDHPGTVCLRLHINVTICCNSYNLNETDGDLRVAELSEKRKSPTHQSEQLVWKAARASGAAPSFFRPETNFVDGGILANNPSLALLTEIAEFNVAKKALDHDEEVVRPYVMLSLGTGVPPVKKTNVVDIFRPDNVQEWGFLCNLFMSRPPAQSTTLNPTGLCNFKTYCTKYCTHDMTDINPFYLRTRSKWS